MLNPSEKLKALEAFILSKNESTDKALSLIEGLTDPSAIRKKVAILLNAGRPGEAADFVRTLSPHEEWCDLGLRAFLQSDNTLNAQQLFDWIINNVNGQILIYKCRLIYASLLFDNLFKKRGNNVIFPGLLSQEESDILHKCLEILNPVIVNVLNQNKINNKIESECLQVAIRIHYLLQAFHRANELSLLLLNHIPLPLEAARMIMRGVITDHNSVKSVPSTLRSQYPNKYEAHLIAALIESQILSNPETAFNNLKGFPYYKLNKSDKTEFCNVLIQISQYLDLDGSVEAHDICKNVLGEDDKCTKYAEFDVLTKKGLLPEAEALLSSIKDERDPTWLQTYSKILSETGHPDEALECLKKAGHILPHPEILKTAARLAYESGNIDNSIENLKKVLMVKQDDISALHNIANLSMKKNDFSSAAEYFSRLRILRPDDRSYIINLAACYIQLGHDDKAMPLYEEAIKLDDPPLAAFLAKASLEKIYDPKKAFETILPLKDKYWDNPQYLQAVLDLSFKSGNEDLGHKALLKLQEMQKEGKAPQDILQAKTIDDLLEYSKHWNEKVKILNQHLVQGKFPWTMADKMQNRTIYMGWYIRTQPIDWHVEEPLVRAAHCVYSTNCFTIYEQPDKTTQLEYIKCPPKGSDVVVDISALITLHRLDLLNSLKKYFGNMYISADYAATLLRDLERLSDLQLSRKIAAELIDKEIKAGRIHILDDIGSVNKRPMPFIHEHTLPEKEEEHYYRLIDMVNVAFDSGKIDEDLFNRLKQIAHKKSSIDSDHPALQKSQPILVDLSTLQTICQMDSKAATLHPFLVTFKIYISRQDQIRNSNDLFQISKQEEIKSWNDDLLKITREDKLFKKQPHTKRGDKDDEHLASLYLAVEKNISLLADDRVLQVLAFNENKSVGYPVFGTDRILLKLHENGIIDIAALSEAYIKLMKWRYRFVVPTHEILFHYAEKYKGNPPGDDLRKTALYLHDCMRDPGLFGGQEQTTRKETMALKLLLSWIHEIASFLVEVWASPDFGEESAKTLTEWVYNEFIPSLPKYIGERGIPVSDKIEEGLLLQCISGVFLHTDMEKAVKGFYSLADCMKLDEKEYQKILCELIDGYDF